MTNEQLFDLVAPVAIYHCTDVCYKKKAMNAWNRIQRTQSAEFNGNLIALPPLAVFDSPAAFNWAKETYDILFQQIVEENTNWGWYYDQYGAKGYKNKGMPEFAGDAAGCFPWYETAYLLKDRLKMKHS